MLILSVASLFFIIVSPNKNKEETVIENFFLGSKNLVVKLTEDKFEKLFIEKTANLRGDWGIYIKDLKHNRVYQLNEDEAFPAASLYKLAVLAKTYDAFEKNELAPTNVLSAKTSDLDAVLALADQAEATPPPQDQEEIVQYPVAEALRLMITISDNYSAILLAQKLGWDNIHQLMKDQNLEGFNISNDEHEPKVTAYAVADYFEKLYKNKMVSADASLKIKDLLANQAINSKIPSLLPKDIRVEHKTGELDSVSHDAGIVYAKKGDYIFVFLSQTDDTLNASDQIAELSNDFYQALEK